VFVKMSISKSDRGGGDGMNELVSNEKYDELLNRNIEQMQKKNEELKIEA